ncbi:hypothetical protein O0I10_001472 [Lichtheimia ornata]|uniref:Uncharacterized protein n=1 Tax=Lichtheimia ornata TaxID=688661 RepID=A0AAD7Y251_9FUNG|nr:uncharacterized protein O0I10_001472 [Lichtheimia ornata]KAJ8662511.1 hypothetical protein O0I10_001472 [Lichtheimia ornata]
MVSNKSAMVRMASADILKRLASYEAATPSQEELGDWINYSLLRPSLSDEELELALQVFRNHTAINDDQLQVIFDLEPYDIDSGVPPSSTEFAFYLVSVTVPVNIVQDFLLQVILANDKNGDSEAVFEDWETMFALQAVDGANCHVRYIGQCRLSCNTPERRFKNIFGEVPSRPVSWFVHFLETRFSADELHDRIKLYEFAGARLPLGSTKRQGDQVEKQLIAAFDIRLLLNAQTAGYNHFYWRPNDHQRQVFETVKTCFYQSMATLARFPECDINKWLACLRHFPGATDDVMNMLVQQARHETFGDSTIAVIIGSGLHKVALSNLQPFFQSKTRPSMATRMILNSLIDVEECPRSNPTVLRSEYFLPLVNLMPFGVDVGSFDQNLGQLIEYLHITRPLICITMSSQSSSCARSNFCHRYGLPRQHYLDHVGVATLQHYAGEMYFNDPASIHPPKGYKTIIIPHLHPDVERFDRRPRSLYTVFYYTWAITFFWMHTAQRLVLELGSELDHDSLCELLYQHCAYDAPNLPEEARELYHELEHAKKELSSHWTRRRLKVQNEPMDPHVATALTLAGSEARSLGATQRMEAIGRAVGRPRSKERQHQVALLWKKQYPDLFVHIPSSDRDAWFKWANGVPQDRFYSLSALACKSHIGAATGDDHPLKKLIKNFGPEGCEDDDWMEDEDQVREALSRRGRYMLGGLEGNALIDRMRQLSESRWMRDRLPFHPLLEGSQVKITRNGSLVLRWMDDSMQGEEAREIVIEMRCFEWIPLELRGEEEMFTLRFLSTGLGLQVNKDFGSDGMSGDFITRQGFSRFEAPALIRQQAGFGLHRYAVDLDRLWRSERARIENTAPIQPMIVQQPQGRSALMCGDNPSKFTLPCNPQDAVYLLQQWLLNDYPEQGGEVTTLNPYKIYTLRTPLPDTKPFEQYIVMHHRSHSFADFWLDLIHTLGNTKNASEILRLNIAAIRQGVTVIRKQTRLRESNAGIEYRIIKFSRPK